MKIAIILMCMATLATRAMCQQSAICNVEPDPFLDPEEYPDQIYGTVSFFANQDSVTVDVDLSGFYLNDTNFFHGFHVHEHGDLTNGCVSTGGHFNPEGVTHGLPEQDEITHVGDFGNIREELSGTVSYTFLDTKISLQGQDSIMDRSVVIHAERDIGAAGTDGEGSSGARMACCIIQNDN